MVDVLSLAAGGQVLPLRFTHDVSAAASSSPQSCAAKLCHKHGLGEGRWDEEWWCTSRTPGK